MAAVGLCVCTVRGRAQTESTGQATPSAGVMKLDGPGNFRDIGGYTTESGRVVKLGLAYRSDSLKQATAADYRVFSELGLVARMDMEGSTGGKMFGEGTKQEGLARFKTIPVELDPKRTLPEALALGPPCPQQLRSVDQLIKNLAVYCKAVNASSDGVADSSAIDSFDMGELYLTIVYHSKAQVRQALEAAMDPCNHPIVFHCTAGKDRTGLVAFLLLGLLGVSVEDRVRDYMRSDTAGTKQAMEAKIQAFAKNFGVSNEAMEPLRRCGMLGVHPVWIEGVHNALSTTWPAAPGGPSSVEQYVTSYLGIDAQTVETYRKVMLEDRK
jgi:hypothetical protein